MCSSRRKGNQGKRTKENNSLTSCRSISTHRVFLAFPQPMLQTVADHLQQGHAQAAQTRSTDLTRAPSRTGCGRSPGWSFLPVIISAGRRADAQVRSVLVVGCSLQVPNAPRYRSKETWSRAEGWKPRSSAARAWRRTGGGGPEDRPARESEARTRRGVTADVEAHVGSYPQKYEVRPRRRSHPASPLMARLLAETVGHKEKRREMDTNVRLQ